MSLLLPFGCWRQCCGLLRIHGGGALVFGPFYGSSFRVGGVGDHLDLVDGNPVHLVVDDVVGLGPGDAEGELWVGRARS